MKIKYTTITEHEIELIDFQCGNCHKSIEIEKSYHDILDFKFCPLCVAEELEIW